MAKIIPINQTIIDSCNGVLDLVNERFRNMSFQERVEQYQTYLDLKEMIEHLLKVAHEEAETYLHHDLNEPKA